MSHCCGSGKKPKPERVRQPEVKEKASKESFWKKLLSSLGLKSEDKKQMGGLL